MTRILVQRGSAGSSSSNQSRSSSLPSSSSAPPPAQVITPQLPSAVKDEETSRDGVQDQSLHSFVDKFGSSGDKVAESSNLSLESFHDDDDDDDDDKTVESEEIDNVDVGSGNLIKGVGSLQIVEDRNVGSSGKASQGDTGCSYSPPPPPPVPPPKPSSTQVAPRRSGNSNSPRIGPSRRPAGWPIVSTRTSPTGSRPSSPRSHCESEGYNSADEQSPCYGSSDAERERQFEIDIRRAKGLEVKRMLEDGNCLFRAVADQVYGDSEAYDLVRQMCIDYMERERDHFSQFITEGFTSYCKRKRRDKSFRQERLMHRLTQFKALVRNHLRGVDWIVYGNNVEIQALAEMYNRPIHIYSYTTEPINIFQGSYNTDTPPVRLTYHHGNHYNSLVDPRRVTIGAGLGFSSLQGRRVDKDQVKAAIKAQQDQQIDNALLAEGRFYSDLELTEKEIEHMVMEVSRAEYLSKDRFKQQAKLKESSTSGAEPSSSGARPSGSESKVDGGKERGSADNALSSSMQMVLSMGFSYLQAIEAYSIFGDDVDSMVCYLLETGNSSRRKGKAAE